MADIGSVLSGITTSNLTVVIVPAFIAGLIVCFFGLAYILVNGRYPKVQFLIFEKNNWSLITQRTIGNKVVQPDLIQLLLRGDKMIGEDLTSFEYGYFNGKKTYIATLHDATLLPLSINDPKVNSLMANGDILDIKVNPNAQENATEAQKAVLEVKKIMRPTFLTPIGVKAASIDPLEIGMAREIAVRYLNVIDQTKQDLSTYNQLLVMLLGLLPWALLLFGLCVAVVFVFPPILDKLDHIVTGLNLLENVTSAANNTASTLIVNSTTGNTPHYV